MFSLLLGPTALATCPVEPSSTPMADDREVYVQILQIDSPDRDSPWDDAPDLYGTVIIGGRAGKLPERPDANQATWDERTGRFTAPLVSPNALVPIDITVWDADPTSVDDQVFLGPVGRGQGRLNLHLDFDPC